MLSVLNLFVICAPYFVPYISCEVFVLFSTEYMCIFRVHLVDSGVIDSNAVIIDTHVAIYVDHVSFSFLHDWYFDCAAGCQKALRGDDKALATVTGVIDGTGSVGAALGQVFSHIILIAISAPSFSVVYSSVWMTFFQSLVCFFDSLTFHVVWIREKEGGMHDLENFLTNNAASVPFVQDIETKSPSIVGQRK